MTFARNHKIGDQVVGLRLAMMKLGLGGYEVLKTTCSNGKDMAQIQIDRPLECDPSRIELSPDGLFGAVTEWNSRVYWRI